MASASASFGHVGDLRTPLASGPIFGPFRSGSYPLDHVIRSEFQLQSPLFERASTILAWVALATIATGCTEARPLRPPFDDELAEPRASSENASPSPAPSPAPSPIEIPKAMRGEAPNERSRPVTRMAPSSVLHIGDSLVGFRGGLSKALEPRFHALNSRFTSDAWGGVGIAQFERSTRLEDALSHAHPDLVIVSLGMNNVEAPHPESLAFALHAIVRRIGARRCIFVGPPTTKPDTGIVDVVRNNVQPCSFIDSRGILIERVDGLHPSDVGGAAWADAIWERITESFEPSTP